MPVPLFYIESDNCCVWKDLSPSWSDHAWRKDIPEMNIKQLTVALPSGDSLCLEDYESYNIFVEATQTFFGRGSEQRVENLYVMGKKNGQVTSYKIALYAKGCSIGDMTVRYYPDGKEWNGKPSTGWRIGIKK